MEISRGQETARILRIMENVEGLTDGDLVKALEILEDMLLDYREADGSGLLHIEQSEIFSELWKRAEDPDLGILYLLGSAACIFEEVTLTATCAHQLYFLAKKLASVLHYKMSLEKAKQNTSVSQQGCYSHARWINEWLIINQKDKIMKEMMKDAEFKIADFKTCPLEKLEPRIQESKKSPEPSEDEFKELRSYWVGLDVRTKRDFMKVSIAKLLGFVERVYNGTGRDTLKQVISSAKEDKKWRFWKCRAKCSKKLSSEKECRNHLEQQHATDFKPSEHDLVKKIGKAWGHKISEGNWEPVDAVDAVKRIKYNLADVKAFVSKSKNGWSKEWLLAADEDRYLILDEIKLLLVSLCERKILACSIRDWVMDFPVKYLEKLEVSKQSLIDSRLMETPQSICFLDCHELSQILDFLKSIKCERNDGTDEVCSAVDNILKSNQVKEKIDFDSQYSFLLLDRRLLKSSNIPVDIEGTISTFDPNAYYAKAHVQGDDIISWLTDYSSINTICPRPIREHNFGIWVAVLRAVEFTCRTLGTMYAKKMPVLHYKSALTLVMTICIMEDDNRWKQEHQWNRYASLLCDKCEKKAPKYSYARKLFVCAVRDVLTGASHPTFDYPKHEDCLNFIRKGRSLSDEKVLKSIEILKTAIIQKDLLIDSKILLIDNSRMSLLDGLTKLSFFDNRTYILELLKPFLLEEIVYMEAKAKSDAAEADLLRKEKKSVPKKKKKTKVKRPL